jgi:hypothetical protein
MCETKSKMAIACRMERDLQLKNEKSAKKDHHKEKHDWATPHNATCTS